MSIPAVQFTAFKQNINAYSLPERFTFPFYYQPHQLAIIASQELQTYLTEQPGWNSMFGLTNSANQDAIGKMFGVLVVKNKQGEIGYISAVSGKFLNTNEFENFVPPVFDTLVVNGFFNEGAQKIKQYIKEINELDNNIIYIKNKQELKKLQHAINEDLAEAKKRSATAKKKRDLIRNDAKITLFGSEYKTLNDKLKQESANNKFYITHLTEHWNEKLALLKEIVIPIETKILTLKNERQRLSANLQQQLFDEYNFLNANGETNSLINIFKTTAQKKPPAAAGECAAPKLLHYAFKHHLKPITMAEFWWGKSPKSEIRKHKNFYPACQGKCKPILGFMLQGLPIDENPMLKKPGKEIEITTLFEDEHMLVINKPAELLSVPGVNIKDCVYQRMKDKYPKATGPLTVHRLDMQTSGIMLIAKSLAIHKILQKQFMDRSIKKRYVALLNGIVKDNKGSIDLPLRPDIEDRPRQMVCYEYGKKTLTHWEVIAIDKNITRIYFYPVTGRTHQLRVHAAHQLGLNTPILGDDLYGKFANRLHLHAGFIQFIHPTTNKIMKIEVEPTF